MKRWNDIEIGIATNMLLSGNSYTEIGRVLDRTSKSVANILNKRGHSALALKKQTINCRVCKNEFTTGSDSREYTCSDVCFVEFSQWNRVGPKHKQEHKSCKFCGRIIQGRRIKIFCNNACSASYRRHQIFEEIESGVIYPTLMMKKYLIHKHGNQCMECGWNKINPISGLVPVQLDHIDGDSDNNDLNNVRLLCPNCHSLTPTYGSLNKNGSNSKKNKRKLEHYHKTKHIGM